MYNTILRGLKNTSYLTLGTIIAQIIGLIGFVYIARFLGPENYGFYVLVVAFVSMFNLFTFTGLNQVIIRENSKNLSNMQAILEQTAGLKNLFCIIAIFLCIFCSLFAPYSFQIKFYIILFSFDLFYKSSSSFLNTIYQASEVLYYNALLTIINKILFVTTTIILLQLGYGILHLFLCQISTHIFTIFVNFYFSRRFVIFKFWSPVILDKNIYKPAIIFSASSFLGFLSTRVDLIMLSMMGSPIEVGIYGVAFSISSRIKQIRGAFSTAFFPILVKRFNTGPIKLRKLLNASFGIFFSMLIFASFFSYFSSDFVMLVFGNEYEESGRLLSILVFNYVIGFSSLPFTNALIATNNEKLALKLESIRALSNVGLNLPLYSLYGMVGIAYSTLLTSLIGGFVIFVFTIYRLRNQGYLS
ncbi:flippase [Euryarchaeota archaeon]|nr:flippase [Euryarchaeota archaeon]